MVKVNQMLCQSFTSRALLRSPLGNTSMPLFLRNLSRFTLSASLFTYLDFRGPKQVWNAFLWSMKGLRAGWRHEASFRLEACLAVVLIPLGLWLGHGGVEKFILILAPMLVLSAE